MQFLGNHSAGTRLRTRIAITQACSVVRADTRELRDLRLHLPPGKVRIAQARIENDGGAAFARTVDMHLAPVYIDQFPRHAVEPAVTGFKDVFVEESGDSENQHDDYKAPHKTAR